mmetsp:Transcript_20597/g.23797  ORF Transcript_20597/g.23797 Transcript_20597/m.23797 type:complete len:239 (+) Transcript_20597:2520-3236(+)
MLPFYDDKNDRDMIFVTHLLKNLSKQHDVRPMIRDIFWINKLKNPKICEAIEGVIEYAIEEVIEDCDAPFGQCLQDAVIEPTSIRRTRSAPRSSIRAVQEKRPEEVREKGPPENTTNKHPQASAEEGYKGFNYQTRMTFADGELADDIDEREADISKDCPIVSVYLVKPPNKPRDYPIMNKRDKSIPKTHKKNQKSENEYEEIIVEMNDGDFESFDFDIPQKSTDKGLNSTQQLDDSD